MLQGWWGSGRDAAPGPPLQPQGDGWAQVRHIRLTPWAVESYSLHACSRVEFHASLSTCIGCCCLPSNHFSNWTFWPMIIAYVLRNAGRSIICNYADRLTSLELLNYYLTLAMSSGRFLHIHAFMHSCIHAFMHLCIHSFIHSFIARWEWRAVQGVRSGEARGARPAHASHGRRGIISWRLLLLTM